MCRQDLLFFVNSFCVVFEPRPTPRLLPFCTYGYQDEALRRLMSAHGREDVCVFKSRDMGATYVVCIVPLWKWLFTPRVSYLLLSRKEELVDDGTADSMFGKLDLQLDNLPSWLLPADFSTNDKRFRQERKLWNPDTGAIIKGESTNNAAGVGGRQTVVVLDELARMDDAQTIWDGLQAVTSSRWANFTAYPGKEFARSLTEHKGIVQIRMHWTAHPVKNVGMYVVEGGETKVLSAGLPDGYEVVPDGKVRSPWYDAECARASNQAAIDTNLDMLWVGAASCVFDLAALDRIERTVVREPFFKGDVMFTPPGEGNQSWYADAMVVEGIRGPLQCWFVAHSGSHAPTLRLAVGVDIAAGTVDSTGRGSSNSSASFWDRDTGEKVAEYTVQGVDPKEFARRVIAICQWFGHSALEFPLLKYEANGAPGQMFGNEVMRLGYSRVYMRRQEGTLQKRLVAGFVPGWHSTRALKQLLMNEYALKLKNGTVINRSADAIRECRQYVMDDDGNPFHMASERDDDPTNARENHGDRVIADMLGASECEVKTVGLIKSVGNVQDVWTPASIERMKMQHRRRTHVPGHVNWNGARRG